MKLLGIDEVGRGPWAGPLVVGACILREPIEGLTDSKKLSAKRREVLAAEIHEKAFCGLGWVSASELDKIGLSAALRKACREAVQQVQAAHAEFNGIIIDGTINFLSDTPLGKFVTVKPKADLLVPEVSAASIIAKVARDNYMIELAERFPGYSFEKHVGYGTAAHKKALLELGPCEEHRFSFRPVAEIAETAPQKAVASHIISGREGEEAAASYLIGQGFEIIERNWKTKWCEIDIVAQKDNSLYFVEVKTRKDDSGIDAITAKKQEQMHFAAELYLQDHPDMGAQLAAISVNGDKSVTNFVVLE
ncbi:MAG: ribonuclease HII [Candidatus Saccharibacteria bacterium]|nr:ribonuclease HII [Candidatus Saccharibacteria bacterium]